MKQLLLIGTGHAHLYILKQLQTSSLRDVEVVLLTLSEDFYYSGMFSGYTEGLYKLDELCINVKSFAEKAGVKFVKGAAMSIDPDEKVVLTDQGEIYAYDVVSFNIGSLTAGTDKPGVLEFANTLKPNTNLPQLIERARKSDRLVVVGGGAGGVELSLSLQAWREKHRKTSVTLVSDGSLLDDQPTKVSEKVETLVTRKNIELHNDELAVKVTENKLVTHRNRIIPFDMLLWLTGPRAQRIFANSNLPVDQDGYLLVENTLQVKKYPAVFGTGDCITLTDYLNVTKNRRDTVCQALVLWENIKGFLENGEGVTFRPQSVYLSILSTGNQNGLLFYRGKAFQGKWVWWLKDRMDRKFIKQFR